MSIRFSGSSLINVYEISPPAKALALKNRVQTAFDSYRASINELPTRMTLKDHAYAGSADMIYISNPPGIDIHISRGFFWPESVEHFVGRAIKRAKETVEIAQSR